MRSGKPRPPGVRRRPCPLGPRPAADPRRARGAGDRCRFGVAGQRQGWSGSASKFTWMVRESSWPSGCAPRRSPGAAGAGDRRRPRAGVPGDRRASSSPGASCPTASSPSPAPTGRPPSRSCAGTSGARPDAGRRRRERRHTAGLAGRRAPDDADVVCECSSFQLEDTEAYAPECGVILNATPDHLDRHGSTGRLPRGEAARLRQPVQRRRCRLQRVRSRPARARPGRMRRRVAFCREPG